MTSRRGTSREAAWSRRSIGRGSRARCDSSASPATRIPALHLEMLAHDYPWDACQLPLNCFDASFRSFEQQVLPELNRRGIAPIGMKSFGGDARAVKAKVVSPEEALAYALSLPVATVVSGMDSVRVLKQNVAVARGFRSR